MKQLARVFVWGAVISFLGSLPLGVLNVTATQLSVENGIIMQLFRLFEWITTVLILLLSINSLIDAIKMEKISSIFPAEARNSFFSGMFLSALNPLHVIFWFGWSTILIERNILYTNQSNYNFYTTGIGFGTIAG